MQDDAKPSSLRNLGPVSDEWLSQVGIDTVSELRRLGAIEAWQRVRFAIGPRVTVTGLYALDGALAGIDWRHLPQERKNDLRAVARAYLKKRR